MVIALKKFNELDSSVVATTIDEIISRIKESNPNLDLRDGVFRDLLVYYQALLSVQRAENLETYLNARSLAVITENPELATEELVTDVFSNFGIDRKIGSEATGEVTIIVSDPTTIVIGAGAEFVANGRSYFADSVFTAKAEEAQINSDTDRLLTPTSDGNWMFSISVTAEVAGSDYALKQGTTIVPTTIPNNYINSYAASDFTGGIDTESNEDLVNKLQLGISAKTMSSRLNMRALLRDQTEFESVVRSSIIGAGEAEMLRDRHSIIPIGFGGKADWYIRTQENILYKVLTKEATLTGYTTDGSGIWQFTLTRDDAPGFYRVEKVYRTGDIQATGFKITQDTRGHDLTDYDNLPAIANTTESAYSRFQTSVVRFEDDLTDATNLAIGYKQEYACVVSCLPKIAAIQDFITDRNIRHYGADCLVKAPVPCFLKLKIDITKQSKLTAPDITTLRTAVIAAVNQTEFVGKFFASQVVDAVAPYLRRNVTVSDVNMIGEIRYPDGTIKYLQDSDELAIPEDPSNMVSSKTVQFFVNAEDIAITVSNGIPTWS